MDNDKILTAARQVISLEADAVALLAESIDENFAAAVNMMHDAKGRVIVSGMGKSGHVGRKIAATLASTGTPAMYVHPAEASHGDLGMLTKDDVVLVLSNSGETPELAAIIGYTRRFGIPMIGVASVADSTLLLQSDIAILLPAAKEACPMGLAPTTSTTMTLALGDALAVVLMRNRQFTPQHYRDLHPGGKLGAKLSTVADLMHRDVPMVASGTPMSDALLIISQMGFGVVGVTGGNGQLLGVVTDGDLRRHMDGLLQLTADAVMNPSPQTIDAQSLAEEAVAIMNEHKITCLFVTEMANPDRAVGILHIHDCLRAGVA